MDPGEYGRTIPLLLEPVNGELVSASAELGRQTRLAHRREARSLGMTTLPAGPTIYINGVAYPQPEEDLTVLMPGEDP